MGGRAAYVWGGFDVEKSGLSEGQGSSVRRREFGAGVVLGLWTWWTASMTGLRITVTT